MSELPQNWVKVKFEDVFDIQGGTQPPKSSFIYEPKSGYVQLLQIRDFGERSVPTFIRDDETLKKCSSGDILIARYGASLGRILTGFSGAYNVAMAKVIIPDQMSKRFVYHLLNSEIFQAPLRLISRSAQSGFNKQDLADIEIPIPPLNEQKRIVIALEHQLEQINSSLKQLSITLVGVLKLKQGILSSAVDGTLTAEWRKEHTVSEHWETVELKNVASSKLGKMLDKAKNQGEFMPYLRNINIRWFDFNLTDIQMMRVSEKEIPDLLIKKNDVLICEGGEPGRCAIWRGTENMYIYQKALHRVRVGENLTPEWLCYNLKVEADSGRLEDSFTGSTIKHLTGKMLAQFQFKLPTITEQIEITRRVNEQFQAADDLEAQYNETQLSLERMIPKLLEKAFGGELVAQDSTDEPASILLEKIQILRAVLKKQFIEQKSNKSPKIRKGRILKRKSVTNLNELLEILERFNNSIAPEELLIESILDQNADLLFELLREGRDKDILSVPNGQTGNIQRILHAN
jgi:type I restriction enzyme, S subunit